VKRLVTIVTLAILLVGLVLVGLSDTAISGGDTNIPDSEVTSSQSNNTSATATITITMYAVDDEQAGYLHTVGPKWDSSVVALGCNCSPQSPPSPRRSGRYCFIATAAYGTPMAEEIQTLREFRDEYLLINPLGQAFVDFYYKVSPPIAKFITEHPSLKPIVRAGLVPIVAMSTVVINTTAVEKAAIVGLLVLVSMAVVIWVIRRQRRDSEYT